MLPPHFANYNVDYQQRLGYLKLLALLGEGRRLGAEELLSRIRGVYTSARAAERAGLGPRPFSPQTLLEHEDIPSWQVGFTEKRLGRLIVWAETLGILSTAHRLSEWAYLLKIVAGPGRTVPGTEYNPFRLRSCSKISLPIWSVSSHAA
jgi:hypothetical protein